MRNLLIISVLFLFVLPYGLAADGEANDYFKRRNYRGGADESDLKVQIALPVYKKNNNEANIQDEAEEGF